MRSALAATAFALCAIAPLRVLAQAAPTTPQPQAQQPSKPSASDLTAAIEEEQGPDPEKGLPRPAPHDQRIGRPILSGRIGWLAPLGSFAVDTPIDHSISTGPSYAGSLGVGLSRYVVLEASGELAQASASSRCHGCSARILDGGLALTYHLAQGIAVDPWISYGVGYRWVRADTDRIIGQVTKDTYQGVDVARIALGADFFPIPQIGFGPTLAGDFGTFVRLPEGLAPSSYAFLQIGVRLTLDPFQRSLAARSASTTARAAAPAAR